MAKSVSDRDHAIGLSLTQESDKQFNKTLVAGAILVFAHLLGIKPAEVEALGLKLVVPDTSILYGAIALLFLHFLFRSLSYGQRGENFLRMSTSKASIRAALNTSRRIRKKKSIKEIKKGARSDIAFYNGVMSPYYVVVTLVVMTAFVLSIIDVWWFGDYLVNNSPLLKSLFAQLS